MEVGSYLRRMLAKRIEAIEGRMYMPGEWKTGMSKWNIWIAKWRVMNMKKLIVLGMVLLSMGLFASPVGAMLKVTPPEVAVEKLDMVQIRVKEDARLRVIWEGGAFILPFPKDYPQDYWYSYDVTGHHKHYSLVDTWVDRRLAAFLVENKYATYANQ